MICRVSRGSYGLSDYLISGKRADSKLTRNQKDNVTSIYGDLETFKIAEKYVNENKHYKSNYLHITLSFSPKECEILNQMDETQRIEKLTKITQEYLTYYTQGNDLENEVIAYAEMHEPKEQAKYNELGKQRLTHIHIGINLHNFEKDKRIKPPFFNAKRDKLFTQQITQRYELETPMPKENRVKNYQTKIKELRELFYEILQDKDPDYLRRMYEMCQKENKEFFYYDNKEIFLKEVKTQKNDYYKAIYKDSKGKERAINLRGRGFERFDLKLNPPQKVAKVMHSTAKVKPNEFKSYQQKIFYDMYKSALRGDFKGLYIDKQHRQIYNQSKTIDILDNGDKLTAKGTDTTEQIRIMLDIAEAKKWDLQSLEISGSEAFKAEAQRQIYERTFEKRLQNYSNLSLDAVAQSSQPERTYTPLDTAKRLQNAKIQKYDINLIKEHYAKQHGGAGSALFRELVVDSDLIQKMGLNLQNYTAQGDKLKNLKTGKSYNVVDFMAKEVKLGLQGGLEWLERNRLESLEDEKKQREARTLWEQMENQRLEKIKAENERQRLESEAREAERKKIQSKIAEPTAQAEQPKTATLEELDAKMREIDEALNKPNSAPRVGEVETAEPSRAEQVEEMKERVKKAVQRPKQRNHSNDYDLSR